MKAIIGNMEANVSADGRSVEFAPPQGFQNSLHLQAFEATGAPTPSKVPESAPGLSVAPVADHAPAARVDLIQGAGLAIVISAVAIALVLRRGLTKGLRAPIEKSSVRRDRPEDDDAARIAFMNRYGGAS